jgi:hypothetical protein
MAYEYILSDGWDLVIDYRYRGRPATTGRTHSPEGKIIGWVMDDRGRIHYTEPVPEKIRREIRKIAAG